MRPAGQPAPIAPPSCLARAATIGQQSVTCVGGILMVRLCVEWLRAPALCSSNVISTRLRICGHGRDRRKMVGALVGCRRSLLHLLKIAAETAMRAEESAWNDLFQAQDFVERRFEDWATKGTLSRRTEEIRAFFANRRRN